MYIKDIFHSIQGEGPYVGYSQVFVRFYGCNIHCSYCDEPDFAKDRRKMTMDEVLSQIRSVTKKGTHSISITGGEPLIQVDALKQLVPQLSLPAYLETNGTLPDHLREVLPLFSYFSVDFKPGFEKEFTDFMSVFPGYDGVFVKYVMLRDFPISDIVTASKIVAAIHPAIPFIIQPVTPFSGVKETALPSDIDRGMTAALARLSDVRVIPQTHKYLGLK